VLLNESPSTWSARAAPPAPLGLLGTGNVLVSGGTAGTASNLSTITSAILYNPATNSWTTTGSMNTARERQTMDVLASGQVLVAGGESFTNHAGTPLSSAELYTP
jgi:hypothetical protein